MGSCFSTDKCISDDNSIVEPDLIDPSNLRHQSFIEQYIAGQSSPYFSSDFDHQHLLNKTFTKSYQDDRQIGLNSNRASKEEGNKTDPELIEDHEIGEYSPLRYNSLINLNISPKSDHIHEFFGRNRSPKVSDNSEYSYEKKCEEKASNIPTNLQNSVNEKFVKKIYTPQLKANEYERNFQPPKFELLQNEFNFSMTAVTGITSNMTYDINPFLIDERLLPKWNDFDIDSSGQVFEIGGEVFVEKKEGGTDYMEFEVLTDTESLEDIGIDWEGGRFNVDYHSWNMVNVMKKSNQFYCMLCRKLGSIDSVRTHCSEPNHIKVLGQCDIVHTFNGYLVRKLDGKYYHCGQCNSLQLENFIKNHIENVHSKCTTTKKKSNKKKNQNHLKNKSTDNIINSPANCTDDESDMILNSNHNLKPIKKAKPKKQINHNHLKNTETERIVSNSPMMDMDNKPGIGLNSLRENDFSVEFFNKYGFKIKNLSWHMIFETQIGYFCGVCQSPIAKDALNIHLHDVNHLDLLQQHPFMDYESHFLRNFQGGVHCAICHIVMHNIDTVIKKHIEEELHINLLNRASNCKKKSAKKLHHKDVNTITNIQNAQAKNTSKINQIDVKEGVAVNRDNKLSYANVLKQKKIKHDKMKVVEVNPKKVTPKKSPKKHVNNKKKPKSKTDMQ